MEALEKHTQSHNRFQDTEHRVLLVSLRMNVNDLLRVFDLDPSSLSSYSTLKPEIVEEADVHDTTKLFDVISVTDSEASTSGGSWVVSPSDFSTRKKTRCKQFLLKPLQMSSESGCLCSLTRAVGGGELKARDLAASVAQDADQLTLISDTWLQPTDGVGVDVARDGYLPPGFRRIFLQKEQIKRSVRKYIKVEFYDSKYLIFAHYSNLTLFCYH